MAYNIYVIYRVLFLALYYTVLSWSATGVAWLIVGFT